MVGTLEVKVMCGIPGSGKSTWIKQEVARLEDDGYTTAVISRDYIRKNMLKDDETYFAHENEVFEEFVRQINEAIKLGINFVFADATHVSRNSRSKLLMRIVPNFDTVLTYEVILCNTATAIARNNQRTGFAKVPESAIESMASHFSIPTTSEHYMFKEAKVERIDTN